MNSRPSQYSTLSHPHAPRAVQPLPSTGVSFTKWITCPFPRPPARFRLFCLPFAGGGASVFRLWGKALPADIEVCPIQLPGREDRVAEPPYTNMQALTEELARHIRPYIRKPFGFFGHSMGALIAFELTRQLRRVDAPLPTLLFLSAHQAPHLPRKRRSLHQLPEPEFINAVRRLGGTPAAVFEHQDLLDFVLPTLRADFTICDTYHFLPEEPLDCAFVLCAGSNDPEALTPDVAAWRAQTTQSCQVREFTGNHFFLQSQRDLLLETIATIIHSL